ncbi:caspase family protein [Aliarcobacter butzleri]|uniref:caspase family protein n=1 Tax=Aliarcobacter butzleri TaxID=28197 RepID=UPI00215AD2F2|nr:caspase family protein [Aliarcobacter butzleri]MCR8710976.1 caspase family protein [Aliarcobacter butzleri]
MKNRKALCIGINAYVKKLDNAINDATSTHELLVYKGYESILKTDVNYQEFEQCLDDFCSSINSNTEAIVLFFAGHGIECNKKNYLLLSDMNDDNPLYYEGYLLENLFNKLDKACNEEILKIIILDACRSDKEKDLLEQLSRANDINRVTLGQVQPSNQKKNYLIAFSTSPGNAAYDKLNKSDTNPNSVYTRVLLESLKSYNMTIEDILKDTRENVIKISNYTQLPWEHSSLNKKFYLDFKSHHYKLVDIYEIPFSQVNDILLVDKTKYLVIGNSPYLCIKDIRNPFIEAKIPFAEMKKTEFNENDKRVLELFNKSKTSDDITNEDIVDLAHKLDSDITLKELIEGKKTQPYKEDIEKEFLNMELISIAKSKNFMVITTSNNDIFICTKEDIFSIELKNKDNQLRKVVISEDEKLCAIACFNRLFILDLNTKEIIHNSKTHYLNEIYSLSFIPSSHDVILCGAIDMLELIINVNTSNEIRKVIETEYYTYNVKFTPNSKKMITTHDEGKIIIWDAKTMQPLETIRLAEKLNNQVSILNLRKEGFQPPTNHIISLSVINDDLVAVGTYNISYCLIDINLQKIIKEYSIDSSDERPYGLDCNETYLVCNGYKKTIYIYSLNEEISYITEAEYLRDKSLNEIDLKKEIEKAYLDLFETVK